MRCWSRSRDADGSTSDVTPGCPTPQPSDPSTRRGPRAVGGALECCAWTGSSAASAPQSSAGCTRASGVLAGSAQTRSSARSDCGLVLTSPTSVPAPDTSRSTSRTRLDPRARCTRSMSTRISKRTSPARPARAGSPMSKRSAARATIPGCRRRSIFSSPAMPIITSGTDGVLYAGARVSASRRPRRHHRPRAAGLLRGLARARNRRGCHPTRDGARGISIGARARSPAPTAALPHLRRDWRTNLAHTCGEV